MDIEKINVGGTQYNVCDTVARAAVSDEFSTGAAYAAGDYCIYENTLFKFTAAKDPGAWDASKVAATQISDELSQLNGKVIKVKKFEVEVTTKANVDSPSGMYQGGGYIKSQPDYPDGTVYAVIMYGARSKADASRGAIVAYRNEDGYFCVSSQKQASTEFIVSVVVFYSD